jgi:hypothetical protein
VATDIAVWLGSKLILLTRVGHQQPAQSDWRGGIGPAFSFSFSSKNIVSQNLFPFTDFLRFFVQNFVTRRHASQELIETRSEVLPWPATPVTLLLTVRTARFNIRKLYVLPTQCVYVFCVDLRTNSDYFPIQH